MLVNMKEFETNSFLEDYHMTCFGKTKQKLRKSVAELIDLVPCNWRQNKQLKL